jgi:predicted nuclease of restriction endonuclease-like (RecB) superfamily
MMMVKEQEMKITEQDYLKELQRIKDTIKQNQNKAMVIVNSAAIVNNYEIGTIINERKVWGNKYIERLSRDLSEYGNGYSKTNLKYMSQFANTFTLDEISQRGVGQISWRTIILIIGKCKKHEEILFYVNLAHKNGWGKDMMCNQMTN